VTKTEPDLITAREAAWILRRTPESLANDRLRCRGIGYYKIGRKILYDRDEIMERVRAGRVEPIRQS